MATDYELILMLDPQAGDDARDKLAADTKSRLESKGMVTHEATWGLRKMAYEIDKRGEADYRFYRFNCGTDLLDDLNHNLRIADGVLRFRIFEIDPDSPITEPPDTEQIMRRDEDEGRGRGRRDDRGGGRRDDRPPRAPREEPASAEQPAPAAPAEPAPAEPAEAPAEPGPAEPAEAPAEAPAETPAEPAAEAPAEPAPAAPAAPAEGDATSEPQ
ncbi:MAG TPA: 30S ribosomal protein S6 [Solirubrobacterales bacterium]|nr:30S ribosomal protein S6 [Solirubrobacterales bacterium]